jgi:ribonuclease-3
VFGALFLDAGIEHARERILALYRETLDALDPTTVPKDPKTELQEYLQKHALPTPTYEVLTVSGEAHQQHFVVECHVPGLTPAVRGEGASRRSAEQQAAAQALTCLRQA